MSPIAKVVTKRSLGDPDGNVQWWLSRPIGERLAHVQELRADYYGWIDGIGPGFRRVHLIVRRP